MVKLLNSLLIVQLAMNNRCDSTTLAQYHNLKPDIGFGQHNDRFDISDLMKAQNAYYDRMERARNRRFGDMVDPKVFPVRERKLAGKNFIKEDNILSRFLKVFANDLRRDVNDKNALNSQEEVVVNRAKVAAELKRRNLQKYVNKLHGIHAMDFQSRKKGAGDPEEEILMHHAVPFDFKIKGYLTQ